MPLFVHERLSTKAILETVKVHAKDKQIGLDLFGDPQRPIHDGAAVGGGRQCRGEFRALGVRDRA